MVFETLVSKAPILEDIKLFYIKIRAKLMAFYGPRNSS